MEKKISFGKKCLLWIGELQRVLKKSVKKKSSTKKSVKKKSVKKKSSTKKSVKKKSGSKKKMVGGDNFAKDLQRAGKGLATAMTHTFDSMANLGKDMKCETDAIMNIGNEIDLGYSQDCPFTKTKTWKWEEIRQ